MVNLKEITVHADSESLAALEQNYAQTYYSNKKPASSGLDEGEKIFLVTLAFKQFRILLNFYQF